MRKLIILLLCCGVIVSMVGCGGNTAPPPTETSPITISERVITETSTATTPPVTAVESIKKEQYPVPSESKDQSKEPTVTTTEPTTTATPTEKITSTVTSTADETVTSQITETTSNATPQFVESEPIKTEPPKVTDQEAKEKPTPFDIEHWIAYARSYAESKGLVLSDTAVDCWDNSIRAGAHCIYLERDIKSRLNRYEKDEDITDVWIWAEPADNDCYDIYIGYA